MNRSSTRILALATMALLAMAFVYAELADSRGRVEETRRLMEAQGNAMAAIVGESSLHGLQVFNDLENEHKTHLLDNANWLAWVGARYPLSDTDLDKFAADLGLWRIMVFDSQGVMMNSSRPPGGNRREKGRLPDSFLQPLITGQQRSGILGGQRARRDGGARVVAAVARPGGGALAVSSKASELEMARTELSPGHLIQTLGSSHGLHYVALQDEDGLIASSTTEVNFAPPADDADLAPLQEGREFATRRFTSPLGPVLEVARVLPLSHDRETPQVVLLRVGLDASLLEDMEGDIRRRSWLRLVSTVAGLVLLVSILMAWQRQRVLRREVDKISHELRRQEEETRRTEKLAAMGHLAAGVAHEIRNPLNTIHMIAQKLGRAEVLEAPLREKANQIRDESRRIEGIVRQFLELARPRPPVFSALDLSEVVEGVVAVHRSAQPEGTMEIVSHTPASLSAWLDREMLVEIVDNLVRNAVEAQPGGGSVEVTLEKKGRWARLVVADQGPGVPSQERVRIFDLYFTTKPEGTGLGLSLVSRMVSAMGGHLELEDSGPGARFVVTLPLTEE